MLYSSGSMWNIWIMDMRRTSFGQMEKSEWTRRGKKYRVQVMGALVELYHPSSNSETHPSLEDAFGGRSPRPRTKGGDGSGNCSVEDAMGISHAK